MKNLFIIAIMCLPLKLWASQLTPRYCQVQIMNVSPHALLALATLTEENLPMKEKAIAPHAFTYLSLYYHGHCYSTLALTLQAKLNEKVPIQAELALSPGDDVIVHGVFNDNLELTHVKAIVHFALIEK